MIQIKRGLMHMTMAELNNYAIENEAIIEVNDGYVEEIICEVKQKWKNKKN